LRGYSNVVACILLDQKYLVRIAHKEFL